jgi:hypothetical protein
MELPAEVMIHNEMVGMKGNPGVLLHIARGYYEANCKFGEKTHRVMLPIGGTVLISATPEAVHGPGVEIER